MDKFQQTTNSRIIHRKEKKHRKYWTWKNPSFPIETRIYCHYARFMWKKYHFIWKKLTFLAANSNSPFSLCLSHSSTLLPCFVFLKHSYTVLLQTNCFYENGPSCHKGRSNQIPTQVTYNVKFTCNTKWVRINIIWLWKVNICSAITWFQKIKCNCSLLRTLLSHSLLHNFFDSVIDVIAVCLWNHFASVERIPSLCSYLSKHVILYECFDLSFLTFHRQLL